MATDNKSLGRFILDGIPPAQRGIPQIEVTFDIDANGILKVTALDKASSRSQHITITASSGLSESEVDKMRREAEANAEADTKRKELIEVRNHADNMVYTAEKMLKDYADKIPADMKSKTEDGVKKLKDVLSSEDAAAIKKATEDLGSIVQGIGSSFYQQPGAAGPAAGAGAGPEPGQGPASSGPSDGDVVDGEFKNV